MQQLCQVIPTRHTELLSPHWQLISNQAMDYFSVLLTLIHKCVHCLASCFIIIIMNPPHGPLNSVENVLRWFNVLVSAAQIDVFVPVGRAPLSRVVVIVEPECPTSPLYDHFCRARLPVMNGTSVCFHLIGSWWQASEQHWTYVPVRISSTYTLCSPESDVSV